MTESGRAVFALATFLALIPAAAASLQVEPPELSIEVVPGGKEATKDLTVLVSDEEGIYRVVAGDGLPEGVSVQVADAKGQSERRMGGTEEWVLTVQVAAAPDAPPGSSTVLLVVQSQVAGTAGQWRDRAEVPLSTMVVPATVDGGEVEVGSGDGLPWGAIALVAFLAAAVALVAVLAVRARRRRLGVEELETMASRTKVSARNVGAVIGSRGRNVATDSRRAGSAAEPGEAPQAAPAEREGGAFEAEDALPTATAPARAPPARSAPPAPPARLDAYVSGYGDGEEAGPGPPEVAPGSRYVNVVLKDARGRDVLPMEPLPPATPFRLLVDIGPLDEATLVAEPPEFPSRRLPRRKAGHALDVALVGEGVDVDARMRRYFLPPAGGGWECRCGAPGDACRCRADSRAPIALDWRTPAAAGRVAIRIAVYYRRNLVQSLFFSAQVGGRRPDRGDAVSAQVDYVLSHDLQDMAELEPRAASILQNDAPDGTHTIVLQSGTPQPIVVTLRDAEAGTAIKAARAALFAVHSGGTLDDPDSWTTRLDAGNAKPADAFVADLRRLAVLGTILFRRLHNQAPDAMRDLVRLLDASDAPVQTSRTDASTLYFPWALLYQLDNDEDEAALRPCRLLREWDAWKGRPLQGRCPYEGDAEHRGPGCLCPYGFWGLRHLLEHQPSIPQGRTIRSRIAVAARPARLAVGACSSLKQVRDHEAELRRELPQLAVLWAEPRDRVLELVATPDLELLYFYCHGGLVDKVGVPTPCLMVGQDERFDGGLLRGRRSQWGDAHWSTTGPLVVINGCETSAMQVRDLGALVDDFMAAGASGVVGTEVPVLESLAREAGLEFLRAFQAGGTGAAAAMQAMRLALLAKGNLMGLAYTPYCRADLRLETP